MKATIRAGMRALGLAMLALAGIAMLTAANRPASKPLPPTSPRAHNWNATVVRTARDSHVLGNPQAAVKLVEYVSYTCPHCADFQRESEAQLRLGFVEPGKGSIEVRSFVRDPVDMTVALLTHCGTPAQFWAMHSAFLRGQGDWIGPMVSANDAQRQRWTSGDFAARTRAIARDFNFYRIMERYGFDRPAVDRCLANKALADRLAKETQEAAEKDYINGTPGFVVDGVTLAGTYNWEALRPQLEARLH